MCLSMFIFQTKWFSCSSSLCIFKYVSFLKFNHMHNIQIVFMFFFIVYLQIKFVFLKLNHMHNIQMFFHALFQCVKWVFVLFFHVYLQIYFVFEMKSHAQHSCSFSLRIFKYVLFITTLKHIFALQNSLGGDENGHLVVGAALPRPELVLWKATSLVWPAKVLRRGDEKDPHFGERKKRKKWCRTKI